MTISIERINQRFNKLNKADAYQRDPIDNSDKKYAANLYEADELPKKVDLRAHMTRVENQGEIGSCTANAMAGAYEYGSKM